MTDTHHYVAERMTEGRPPPYKVGGVSLWVKRNLLGSWFQAILTVITAIVAFILLKNFVSFISFDAVFQGTTRQDCLAHDGACWPYVYQFFHQYIYGNYSLGERWRVDTVFMVGALGLISLLSTPSYRLSISSAAYGVMLFIYSVDVYFFDGLSLLSNDFLALLAFSLASTLMFETLFYFKKGSIVTLLMLVFYPCFALIMLNGGNFDFDGFTFGLEDWGLRLGTLLFWVEYIILALIVSTLFIALIKTTGQADTSKLIKGTVIFWLTTAVLLFILDTDFGLAPVRTGYWGGLLITLVIAVAGIVVSLPIGVALALGRRSQMPVIKFFSIAFIEFWRGVPLITVLFMANNMIPLFLPKGVESLDGLVYVLIGVALFSSAYMAETVRGGLQAIPKGQYEGAMALGLSYGQMMRMIILPQGLKLVIPGIVNTFIGLFKDTTLVSIVGIADLLGVVQRSFSDPTWATPTQASTGYLVAATIFFLFCFMMSRYSLYMERKLDTGHKK